MDDETLVQAEQTASDSHSAGPRTADAEFWFDPSCPFTWRTSVWLRDVAGRHGLHVDWRVMSLTVLNEGREVPEALRESLRLGSRALRVLVAAGGHDGPGVVPRLYEALGTRWHEDGRTPDAAVLREALEEAGLSPTLADAADDPSHDSAIRASHEQGQDRVGMEVGSPVLALRGRRGFFGPVVVPPPEGDAADRLFEALRLLSTVPTFSELKTVRAPI